MKPAFLLITKIIKYNKYAVTMQTTLSPHQLKIGMIDVDLLDNGTRHPNLAQMKMSAFCKKRGHDVRLLYTADDLLNLQEFDILLASKVFNFTSTPSQLEPYLFPYKNNLSQLNLCLVEALNKYELTPPDNTVLLIGGTGFFEKDGGRNLHHDVEHIMPDYDLYLPYVKYKINQGRNRSYFDDYLNYSIGFTTRGCFRKCHFCVNKKYDHAFVNSPIEEFLDTTKPMIYLWDDNIFALLDGWEDIFDQLIATRKPFQFRQGLDIRLLKGAHAKKLCNCKYHGDFIFAFDHVNQANLIERKLQLWRRWCGKTTKLYVLCAFDSWDYEIVPNDLGENYCHYFLNRMNNLENQDARDQEDIRGVFERIKILMKYGCLPYIMRFQNYKQSKYKGMYVQLARWCNQPNFFKKKSFRQFCEANREYSKTDRCAAYQSMIDFEKERPDIAKEYFDMRYDDENECITSYGRKITRPCKVCTESSENYVTWNDFYHDKDPDTKYISQYYEGKLDFICLLAKKSPSCSVKCDDVASKLISLIKKTDVDEIIDIIDKYDDVRVTSDTIPQISGMDIALFEGLDYLVDHECSFEEFGENLPNRSSDNAIAKQKFGENHAKLLSQLDLAWIDKTNKPYKIHISPIGKIISNYKKEDRSAIASKLILRIPIIQEIIRESKNSVKTIYSHLSPVLNESTVTRRSSTINQLIDALSNIQSDKLKKRIRSTKNNRRQNKNRS